MDKDTYNPRGQPDAREPIRYQSLAAPTRQQPDQETKIHENEKTPIRPDNLTFSNVTKCSLLAAVSGTVLQRNIWRRCYKIYNDGAEDVYILESEGKASADNWSYIIEPGQMYEPPQGLAYAGAISGFFPTQAGVLRVTDQS